MLISVTLNAIGLTQDISTDVHIMIYIILVAQLISTKDNINIDTIKHITLVGH